MTLVIVESPTKARTIKQFLGKDFVVKSSFGHTRDLPARELAINIEKDFKPKYVIIPKAKKVISQLKDIGEVPEEILPKLVIKDEMIFDMSSVLERHTYDF